MLWEIGSRYAYVTGARGKPGLSAVPQKLGVLAIHWMFYIESSMTMAQKFSICQFITSQATAAYGVTTYIASGYIV